MPITRSRSALQIQSGQLDSADPTIVALLQTSLSTKSALNQLFLARRVAADWQQQKIATAELGNWRGVPLLIASCPQTNCQTE